MTSPLTQPEEWQQLDYHMVLRTTFNPYTMASPPSLSSCAPILQTPGTFLPHNLAKISDLTRTGWRFINVWVTSHYLWTTTICWVLPTLRVLHVQMLTSPQKWSQPICVWHEEAICCSDSTNLWRGSEHNQKTQETPWSTTHLKEASCGGCPHTCPVTPAGSCVRESVAPLPLHVEAFGMPDVCL